MTGRVNILCFFWKIAKKLIISIDYGNLNPKKQNYQIKDNIILNLDFNIIRYLTFQQLKLWNFELQKNVIKDKMTGGGSI